MDFVFGVKFMDVFVIFIDCAQLTL